MSNQADKDAATKKEAEKKGAEENDSLTTVLNWISKKWEGISRYFPESSSGNFGGKAMELFSNLPSMIGSFLTSVLKLAAPILSKFGINLGSDKEISDLGNGLAQISIGHMLDKTAEAIKESEKPKKDAEPKSGAKDQKPEEKTEEKPKPVADGSGAGNTGNGAATAQTEEQKAEAARLAAAEKARKDAEKAVEKAKDATTQNQGQKLQQQFSSASSGSSALTPEGEKRVKEAVEGIKDTVSGWLTRMFGSKASAPRNPEDDPKAKSLTNAMSNNFGA